MKNDNHPLISALQRPNRKMPMMPMPPTLECSTDSLGQVAVGQPVQLSVSGVVQSVGDDGKVMVEVQDVESEGPDEAETPPVLTIQESHSP